MTHLLPQPSSIPRPFLTLSQETDPAMQRGLSAAQAWKEGMLSLGK